jgi:hypothetical protein
MMTCEGQGKHSDKLPREFIDADTCETSGRRVVEETEVLQLLEL